MSDAAIENAGTTETKPPKSKAPKKSVKSKTGAPKGKHVKAQPPHREKKPQAPRESREGWGTFALRLPISERDAFHAASGAAGASRFARIVLNAFSNDDTAAFAAAIAEAKKLR